MVMFTPEELYENTMLRLQKVGISGTLPTKEHIVYLADEIEVYRAKIFDLEGQLENAKIMSKRPAPAADLETQRLKDAIVAQFLARYAPEGRCRDV